MPTIIRNGITYGGGGGNTSGSVRPSIVELDISKDLNNWIKNTPATSAYSSISFENGENTISYKGTNGFEFIYIKVPVKAGRTYQFSIDYFKGSSNDATYQTPYAPFICVLSDSSLLDGNSWSRYAQCVTSAKITNDAITEYITYTVDFLCMSSGEYVFGLDTGTTFMDNVDTTFKIKNARIIEEFLPLSCISGNPNIILIEYTKTTD